MNSNVKPLDVALDKISERFRGLLRELHKQEAYLAVGSSYERIYSPKSGTHRRKDSSILTVQAFLPKNTSKPLVVVRRQECKHSDQELQCGGNQPLPEFIEYLGACDRGWLRLGSFLWHG